MFFKIIKYIIKLIFKLTFTILKVLDVKYKISIFFVVNHVRCKSYASFHYRCFSKSEHTIQYPDISSVLKPFPHKKYFLIPVSYSKIHFTTRKRFEKQKQYMSSQNVI